MPCVFFSDWDLFSSSQDGRSLVCHCRGGKLLSSTTLLCTGQADVTPWSFQKLVNSCSFFVSWFVLLKYAKICKAYSDFVHIMSFPHHFPIISPSFPHHFPIIFPWFSHISTGLSQLITIFRQALGLLSPPCGSTW
jgi:hypothetical protein